MMKNIALLVVIMRFNDDCG